jgi:hypothetical protein
MHTYIYKHTYLSFCLSMENIYGPLTPVSRVLYIHICTYIYTIYMYKYRYIHAYKYIYKYLSFCLSMENIYGPLAPVSRVNTIGSLSQDISNAVYGIERV